MSASGKFHKPCQSAFVSGGEDTLQAQYLSLRVPCASNRREVLEAFAPRRGRAGFALIAVDDDDLIVAPPEADGTAAKAIWPAPLVLSTFSMTCLIEDCRMNMEALRSR